jgi:hypothetical protein
VFGFAFYHLTQRLEYTNAKSPGKTLLPVHDVLVVGCIFASEHHMLLS